MKGTLEHHESFSSKWVAPRNVDVWLPPGYADGPAYPVIYMHDGQNLFDPKTAFIGVEWGVDNALMKLFNDNKASMAILVGIWNTPERVAEYMPERPFKELTQGHQQDQWVRSYGAPKSDDYLRFIVEELKPFVDSKYRTLSNRQHTHIMGSSMGGLVSVYTLCEYSSVFRGAACLSTHWPAGDGMMIPYLQKALPDPASHRIYFDHGTETLDADYGDYQERVDHVMKEAGYNHGESWVTRKFEGEEHSERAWRKRAGVPLAFLLGS